MNTYRGRLIEALKDEDYRYAYDEEFADSRMATQIKVIREQRENMTQAQLAEKSDMRQSRISTLENVDYSAWSISTLRRLARALGVRLSFKFESWGELLSEVESFSREALQCPDFEHDPAFAGVPAEAMPAHALETFSRLNIEEPEDSKLRHLSQAAMARLGDRNNYGIIGRQNS